ncbi:11744_t:CDS:2 [Racocetra fulgida]|uniref:11744_t:CDS:1 n=1 Tax=Racocetra fulgida TaxID=60492 RepID=A0A9N9GUY1_9GLOM|nr:11744_t:CDS:2 [Racocetra fulgida]
MSLYTKTVTIQNLSDTTTYWTTTNNYHVYFEELKDDNTPRFGPSRKPNQVWLFWGSGDNIVSILSVQCDKNQPLAFTYNPDCEKQLFTVRPYVPYNVTQLFKITIDNGGNFSLQSVIDSKKFAISNDRNIDTSNFSTYQWKLTYL